MGSGHLINKDRFLTVLKVNLVVFIAELSAGWYSGSLSLTSDSFHASLHVLASLIALASEHEFFGFSPGKIKLWSAVANIILFFPLAAVISYEAYKRLNNPPMLELNAVFFIVAFMGLAANIYTAVILHKKSHEQQGRQPEDRNRFLLFVHMIFDTIGSVIVIIGGVEIMRRGYYFLDPQLSFVLAGLIVAGALWMSWELFQGDK